MRLRTVLVVSILTFMSACAKPGQEYFPILPVGSQMKYAVELGRLKGEMVIRTESKQIINGKQYYKEVAVYSGIPGLEPEVVYERLGSDGIYALSGSHMDKPEYLDTPLPLRVGAAWRADNPEGPEDYKAESIETLELFDRAYERCMKISFSLSRGSVTLTGVSYYAPHVGLAKTSWNAGVATFEMQLESEKH